MVDAYNHTYVGLDQIWYKQQDPRYYVEPNFGRALTKSTGRIKKKQIAAKNDDSEYRKKSCWQARTKSAQSKFSLIETKTFFSWKKVKCKKEKKIVHLQKKQNLP